MVISEKDLSEIKNRDFLLNVNHYNDYCNKKSNLIYGTPNLKKCFLTIVIPIYDHPFELIFRAINSVLFQKCNYEIHIIIIDDYVKDNRNVEILEYLKNINDDRICYYKNEENLGVFANWNRGIELSNSEWITILHSDDFFKNNFLNNMKNIIDNHPEIDQLCCNYKLLKVKDKNINFNNEYVGIEENTIVRKVKYTEYFYEMKTSVKGSLYKKEKLLKIGGFRSQGDGIGLDDYPLMLRYAYYFNTYLIESNLYCDSWGYNDSLNIKHWFPDLVENYYLWKYFALKMKGIKKFIYLKNAIYLLKKRAEEYDNGTSWVGIRVPIDMKLVQCYCDVNFSKCNKFEGAIVSFLARCFNYTAKHPLNKFNYKLSSGISNNYLE